VAAGLREPGGGQVLRAAGGDGRAERVTQAGDTVLPGGRGADFQKQVIIISREDTAAGRTPNPCVMCNEKLKFGTLISGAAIGGGVHRDGHFARVERARTAAGCC